MADKETVNKEFEKNDPALEPCEKPHSMETSRPTDSEEACDEGVK